MSAPSDSLVSLTGLDPESYRPHGLHSSERSYLETNCYTDILIELLHARGLEPTAAMGVAARMDFEGDQWTFLKPFAADLELLYGLDIHEMQPYRPLPLQALEQIQQGRTIIVELDSWYLPDTVATSYRREHVKSSVVVEGIDLESQRLRYFHGAGLYELADDDYRGVFRIGHQLPDDVLPPYTELARFDAGTPLVGEELRETTHALLADHLRARPRSNPFERFGAQLEQELPRLLEGDLAEFHAYAFATVRQAGAAFEVLDTHAQWLLGEGGGGAGEPLEQIVQACKVLSFRLARRRAFDPSEALTTLCESWEVAMGRLEDATG
jgi:hypothetical protein